MDIHFSGVDCMADFLMVDLATATDTPISTAKEVPMTPKFTLTLTRTQYK